ncbi:MAG TPA: hypothetical protein VEM95_04040, partial [Thermoplasmata archaeon]|nr:hypothetical protein [Thermoplasmata archaeon]
MYPYGPYAPPYASAPAYAPRSPRTPKAILWSYVALALYLAFLATAALLAFFLDRLLASLPANPGPAELVGASLPFLAAAVLLILLGLFVVIVYFIGFGYLYAGRNEFGPAHARNVRLAMYLLVAALVAFLAGLVISLIGGSVAIRSLPGGSLQVDSGTYYLLVAVSSIVGVVVAALVAGTLVLSIRALARPKHEVVLYAAAGLGTATPGIAGSLALLGLPRFLAVLQAYLDARGLGSNVTTPPIDPSVGVPGLVGAALGL